MELSNYHSHCDFCDGRAPMEAFVHAALDVGFHSHGISSHAPLPFPARHAMPASRVDKYLTTIDRLKEKYDGYLHIYAGMEIDYVEGTCGPADPYYQQLPLDYRIGAVHYVVHPVSGRRVDIDGNLEIFREAVRDVFDGDLRALVDLYYDSVTRMVELGGFDFVAHLDKVSVNAGRVDSSVTASRHYRDRLFACLEAIAKRDIFVEINTKAYRERAVLFPHQRYLRRMLDLGVKVVVNSDAHEPINIDAGRAGAFARLYEAGYERVMTMKEGKWTEIAF
jgi:histidinol-phosphatase (PHP family)